MADDLEGLNFTMSLDGSTQSSSGAYIDKKSTMNLSSSIHDNGQSK